MNTFEALLSEMLGGIAKVALSLDADHQQQLALLEGRSLRIHCTNPPQKVTLRVTAGSLDIVPGSNMPTDATVTGTFTDLLALVRGGDQSARSASNQPSLRVSGDALVMRDFARFFESYNPDWSTLQQAAPLRGPLPGPGSDLFEALRGTAEVGLASLGKALGGLMQGGASQVQQATRDEFTGDNEFAAATERLQSLRGKLQQLNQRVDSLASDRPSSTKQQ
ncbi:MAG: SCP2 sterol-binding domain-containing protein [Pseudomonadales bacterium]